MEPSFPLIYVWFFWIFAVGAFIGSWLNLCIDRLPLEKSVIWPSSRCETCLTPLRWYDNIPILSYMWLHGRCRTCKTGYSARTLIVEFGTATAFVALFYVEIILNWHNTAIFTIHANEIWQWGVIPWQAWAFWLQHVTLVGLLIIASFCDLARREIPLVMTITGTIIGLIFSTMFPWPWPSVTDRIPTDLVNGPWYMIKVLGKIPEGVMPWPAWGPLPMWAPAGTWRGGLLSGLMGAFVGMMLLRAVRFVFSRGLGKEALGLGDADLMMMAGAFLGWQVVLVAFFVGAFLALFLAVPMLIFKGENSLPFGPALALGIIVTWLNWSVFAPSAQMVFFDWVQMVMLGVILLVGLFVAAVLLRWRGGHGNETETMKGNA